MNKNDALKEKLENMWRDGASSQEIADTLLQFGLKMDAAQAENLLSAIQNRQAKAFGEELIDNDQLEKVVGGNDADLTGKCTGYIYTRDCAATVEKNSWCGSNDACLAFSNRYKYEKNPPINTDFDL